MHPEQKVKIEETGLLGDFIFKGIEHIFEYLTSLFFYIPLNLVECPSWKASTMKVYGKKVWLLVDLIFNVKHRDIFKY
jgi:hypothetical protein